MIKFMNKSYTIHWIRYGSNCELLKPIRFNAKKPLYGCGMQQKCSNAWEYSNVLYIIPKIIKCSNKMDIRKKNKVMK